MNKDSKFSSLQASFPYERTIPKDPKEILYNLKQSWEKRNTRFGSSESIN